MVSLYQTALALLVFQIYVSAAPSDMSSQKQTELGNLDSTNNQPSPPHIKNNANLTENQRQKRYYANYGLPPFSPHPYPYYNKRDQASDLGLYGLAEDPLSIIHRRLTEIAIHARQPAPPPPPPIAPHFPLFIPVFFIPQISCPCEPPSIPTTEQPPSKDKPANEGTTPNIENRFPAMEDERQNWGLVADENEEDVGGEDFSRPISFDPIRLDMSTSRPAPPIEHGSNQAGQGGTHDGTMTTTIKPAPPSNDVPSPPLTPTAAEAAPYAPNTQPPRQTPSACDSAILSCCHMPQVTYDCFAVLGCPDPTSYGNPCDPLVILKVISRFQNFYRVKTG